MRNTQVADKLRAARGVKNVLESIRSSSMDSKVERIKEALDESVDELPNIDGPVRLESAIGKIRYIVGTDAKGSLFRMKVTESDDDIKLGHPEVFSSPIPSSDIADEMLTTAKAATQAMLEGAEDEARAMVEALAQTLGVKGDLKRRMNLDLALKGLSEDRWYYRHIAENSENIDIDIQVSSKDSQSVVNGLVSALSEARDKLRLAMASNENTKNVKDAMTGVEKDISKALKALESVDVDDDDEMARVYESVVRVAPLMLAGAKNLTYQEK